jgi:hypothetical protein
MNNKQDFNALDSSPAPKTVLHSSASLPWQGIACEQRYHLAGEYSYPPFSVHLICIHQGPPSFLEQIGNGQSHTGLMPPAGIQIIPAGIEFLASPQSQWVTAQTLFINGGYLAR